MENGMKFVEKGIHWTMETFGQFECHPRKFGYRTLCSSTMPMEIMKFVSAENATFNFLFPSKAFYSNVVVESNGEMLWASLGTELLPNYCSEKGATGNLQKFMHYRCGSLLFLLVFSTILNGFISSFSPLMNKRAQ
jgi:hypothetical protein